MPAKLESCVKQLMEKQGVSESRAYAICTASKKSADAGLFCSDKITYKTTIDEVTGFLTSTVNLARTGVQHYIGLELGLDGDRAFEKIGVLRPAEEVFHVDSIKSFYNLVLTDDHPNTPVTIDNVKELQVGSVSEVTSNHEKGILTGIATITDKHQIDKLKSGKVEVSVGYSHDLVEEKGVFQGVDYEFVQKNIRANHLAIVDAGRCGSACKINLDHLKEKNVIITIDGIDYNVEDAQLAQAIKKQKHVFDAEKEEMKKKLDQAEEEKEEMKKEKDKSDAAKDALSAKMLKDEDINKLVADRAELLVSARNILGDKMPECIDCPMEIKSAVVDHIFPDMKLDGKSKEYISAAYDMAIDSFSKAKKSVDKLNKDFSKDKDGNQITRDSVRNNYLKSLGMEV